jgi:rubrerythrin
MDEAMVKHIPDIGLDHEIEDEDFSPEEKIHDLERVMEVVMRMLPKEHAAGEIYESTARIAQRELTRTMFEWLAEQERQHEKKLKGILDLLKMEISELKKQRKH